MATFADLKKDKALRDAYVAEKEIALDKGALDEFARLKDIREAQGKNGRCPLQ